MHSFSLVAIARNLTILFALALVAPSCGSAEHIAPNSVNVIDENAEPHNSLYRHHDIMLQMKQKNDVFGLVEAGPELVEEYSTPEQEPASAQNEAKPLPSDAQLARADSLTRPAGASARAPMAAAQLWRVRVYHPEQVKQPIVFDHAGIAPKIGAVRPAVLDTKPSKSFRPMQKQLRKRALTRFNDDGQVIRTHKKPGSVI